MDNRIFLFLISNYTACLNSYLTDIHRIRGYNMAQPALTKNPLGIAPFWQKAMEEFPTE